MAETQYNPNYPHDSFEPIVAVTGPDGSYRATLPRGGDFTAQVTAPGFAEQTDQATLKRGEERRQDFTLVSAVALFGRVVTSDGKAVPGRVLSLHRRLVAGQLPVPPLDPSHWMQRPDGTWMEMASRATDDDGAFRFEGIESGEYLLGLAFARAPSRFVSVRAPHSAVRWVVDPGPLFVGRVTDAAGKPLANVNVSQCSRGKEPVIATVRSDASGAYRLPFAKEDQPARTTIQTRFCIRATDPKAGRHEVMALYHREARENLQNFTLPPPAVTPSSAAATEAPRSPGARATERDSDGDGFAERRRVETSNSTTRTDEQTLYSTSTHLPIERTTQTTHARGSVVVRKEEADASGKLVVVDEYETSVFTE